MSDVFYFIFQVRLLMSSLTDYSCNFITILTLDNIIIGLLILPKFISERDFILCVGIVDILKLNYEVRL